jgi:hypothetical protein
MYAMKRTTIFVDEKLLERSQRHARQRGVSFATVVRDALTQYLASGDAPPIPSFAGRFRSDATDTSERVDELLWRDPHG